VVWRWLSRWGVVGMSRSKKSRTRNLEKIAKLTEVMAYANVKQRSPKLREIQY